MIDNFLINIGLKCGTVKNFNSTILAALRINDPQMWYFLTPVKVTDNGSGYMEATLNLAFPVLAIQDDTTEAAAISRVSEISKEITPLLINTLKRWVNVPTYTFSIVPFWGNEKNERTDRKDFANVRTHIINGVVRVRFRESWIECNC